MAPIQSAAFLTQFNIEAIKDFTLFEQQLQNLLTLMPLHHVYVESHRSGIFISEKILIQLRKLFEKYNLHVSGAITFTCGSTSDTLFDTFCYAHPDTEKKIRQIVHFTASLFDEIILDDFFFTHCKCPACIKEKGNQTWETYRLEKMKFVATQWVLGEAKKTNPKVKVIIKYPNWYEAYQTNGYNLEVASAFDGIYTGTETRDPHYTQQNLQRYNSYFLMDYLNGLAPHQNAGAWFDLLDCTYNLNSAVEQARLSLFGKAKEITLYNLGDLLDGDLSIFTPLLGHTYRQFNHFINYLGNPIGIATYKPLHSYGENYLEGYLGMLGLPLKAYASYPLNEPTLFLTAHAAHDPLLLDAIIKSLYQGHTVILTRSLAHALQGKGLEELITLDFPTEKSFLQEFGYEWEVCAFKHYTQSSKPILFTQLNFATNDAMNSISGFTEAGSIPLLISSHYAKGQLYILNLPDTFGDLYQLPAPLINKLRQLFMAHLPLQINGPTPFSLFLYDNDYLAIHSFADYTTFYTLLLPKGYSELLDMESGKVILGTPTGQGTSFELSLLSHCYKVLKAVKSNY
ncbi:hypothetical protein CS063_02065 [Sporanaerobium hydrogeniformans]|uniref:Uncharacterized protein n=1 Tax=Sporanaerobium hydrogeniformans TaxID=3072179 RepID=A0AC61DHL4_9FIRM|nr:hypothetical protein [Sporanaerobium hydrogeniformans]PHV72283.1 hypothetical protein CS063_02065 [Sporanaerobium hydrogeniformans]